MKKNGQSSLVPLWRQALLRVIFDQEMNPEKNELREIAASLTSFPETRANALREGRAFSVSVAVWIKDESGRLLFIKKVEEGGKWGPPAGRMEFGENPILAALRETQEEAGIIPKLTGLLAIRTITTDGIPRLGFVFAGEIPPGSDIKPLDKGEIAAAEFLTRSEIEKLIEDGQIFMPDFNLPSLQDLWSDERAFPVSVIR